MPFRMRDGKRLRNRPGDFENPIDREASFGNRAVERLPLDEFHGEEVDTVGFVHGMDGDDVRVVARRRHVPRAESARAGPDRRHPGGKDFERDVASELRVGRAVDLAHAACAEGSDDFKCSQTIAGR